VLAGQAEAGSLQLDHRSVGPGPGAAGADEVVDGAFLVVVATTSAEVNDAVAAAARARGALVARADDAEASDALWSAVAALGPVEVSVGTAGAAPALAAWVADRLDEGLAGLLGADAATLEALAELLAELRRERVTRVEGDPAAAAGAPDWRSAIDRSMLELISSGRMAEAKERLQACRSSS
jgi:siroheme synthase-like protein